MDEECAVWENDDEGEDEGLDIITGEQRVGGNRLAVMRLSKQPPAQLLSYYVVQACFFKSSVIRRLHDP